MPVSCDPNELIAAARCFLNKLTAEERSAIQTYLLALRAGVDPDPTALANAARCFQTCLSSGQLKAIQAYLLCSAAISSNTYSTDGPVDDLLIDGDEALQRIIFSGTSLEDVQITNCPALVLITLTAVAQIDTFVVTNCDALPSISFPAVVTVVNGIAIQNCAALVSCDLGTGLYGMVVNFDGNGVLATVALTAFSFTNGTNVTFMNCALTAASVNHILARCVASGLTTSTIDLSGGTSAAPSGQGILDAATLVGNGCTVTTN